MPRCFQKGSASGARTDLREQPGDHGLECVPREDRAGVIAPVRQWVPLGVEENLDAAGAQELDVPPEHGVPGQVNVRVGDGGGAASA